MIYFVKVYLPTAHNRYLGPFNKEEAEKIYKKFDGLNDADGFRITEATIEHFETNKNLEKELVEEFSAVMVK